MGYYINPADGSSKEEWLAKNGRKIPETQARAWNDFAGEQRLVCCVNNPSLGFSAAGIAYSPQERDVFLSSEHDQRPRTWWEVPKEQLKQFVDAKLHAHIGL